MVDQLGESFKGKINKKLNLKKLLLLEDFLLFFWIIILDI